MLRVCKKGIVFIEPNDHEDLGFWGRFIQSFKNSLKRMLGKTSYHPDHFKFEESGNYIYSLSKRELEKMALGINLRHIAFKYLNDAYEKGVEFELAASNGPLMKKIKQKIKARDRSDRWGYTSPGLIIGIIFKQAPSKEEIAGLEKEGFTVSELPLNPYSS